MSERGSTCILLCIGNQRQQGHHDADEISIIYIIYNKKIRKNSFINNNLTEVGRGLYYYGSLDVWRFSTNLGIGPNFPEHYSKTPDVTRRGEMAI